MIRLLFSCCLLLALSAAQLAAQSPSTATINAGGSYTFTAGTTTPAAQYQWLKNGVPIPNATGASFTIAAGTPRDGGTYSVTIATAGGATTGPATRLTVSSGYLTTTLAGKAGVSGRADGPGDVARFSTPSGLGVDAAGNFYVADSANSRLCRITPNGIVSTLATPLTLRDPAVPSFSSRPEGLALDAAGNVYFADGNAIRRLAPDGTVTTVAGTPNTSGSTNGPAATALFQNPTGVAVDAQGNIFVSDYTQRIRKISPAREVTTVAGTGQIGAADGPGLSARFNNPQGIAVDAAGTIYVADYNNNCVRKIAPDGTVSTLAGVPGSQGSVDGPATTARFQFPRFVAIDRSGQVFVADDSHTIRRISPAGVVTTIAGSSFATGTTDGIGAVARFNQPRGLAVDAGGTLAIVDGANSTVRLARLDSEPVPATTIAQQPVAFDAVVALPMSLSVTPAGAPPFTYQWLKDGAMVAGATAASLRLDSTRTADAGTYTVIVTGEGGATTSDPAVVTVRTGTQAPAIVGQSRGLVTATAGEETILYLSASGYPTPSVQWYRDGTVIAGATNSFFPLSRAQVSDAGVYTAQASNAVGQLTGESATVVVNPKVTRTYITPADGVVAVGGTVSFALEATLGGATATYQWLKNGVPLPGQNGPTLTLNPVQGRDSAIYSVTVGNGSGAATSAAMVLGVQSGYTVSTFASRAGNFGGTTGTGVAANFFYPEGLVLDRDGNVYVA
ncbi:MAG: immunoglobulin domain-containing protein, partial [Verrucomicrobia bacterium]|nr:immunoglobulin domain-containing protein [Verrucomicrobiota bacterium]